MWTGAEIFVRHIVGTFFFVKMCTGASSFRTLLLLKSGSSNQFDAMWNSQTAINDPDGNYSMLEPGYGFVEVSDFKVIIDPLWGDMHKIGIIGFNNLGDELCHVRFDVTGRTTSKVSDWFNASYIDDMYLQEEPGLLSTVARDGEKELLIMTSNEVWFSILHSGTVDPKMVLAVNSSATIATGAETNVYLFQLAKNCFCTEFLSKSSPMAAMCTEDCPGNAQYKCGSTNVGFYSVYSATVSPNALDSLPYEPTSVLLMTFTFTGGWNHTINISAELFTRGWLDGFVYVDKISVNATNSTGHNMLFSFLYWNGEYYKEYQDNGNIYFDTDGIPVDLHVLLLEGLQILYEWDVVESTIALYGPPEDSYVDVPMIAVFAEFGDLTTTSEVPSTTESGRTSLETTDSSTEAVTSSISTSDTPLSTTTSYISSLYYVFDNQSILINGTMYCPCNDSDTVTQTPNLTSIYSDSNKTFDELIADLTLDAATLSSTTRKYTSATDNRASATTLGTVGIAIIVSCISFIVYLDSARLILEATKIKKNYKTLKKRLSKRSLKVEAIQVQCKEEDPNIPDILK